ncbi:SMP-30/gluconolactonase/LRE family protein [Amnibacterium sp. CER49]|uniref:SMP-30/gluconolactonase/LRE family protein n=1 Tax=Amnibacterium sp. CER49 TaxID=3039161 RepID=UPI002448FABF|nr:SMP-30/gluconolactonase/LRE family protein [Amnibacterium sp. CER49]MDH2444103.1 SMP-30/gluconolactonase/LRE family protein [Amnibacterium sp. CER49]
MPLPAPVTKAFRCSLREPALALAYIRHILREEGVEVRANEVVGCQNVLGESVLWHAPSRRLYWLDLADPALFSLDPGSGAVERRRLAGAVPLGALACAASPHELVLVKREGVHLLDLRDGRERLVAHPLHGRTDLAYNDAGVDAAGRLWVGTVEESETRPSAELFVVETDGTWRPAVQGLVICNGPVFSPDGALVYVSDTAAGLVRVFDVVDTFGVANGRVFARFAAGDGLPDGLAVDSEGALWVAHWAGGRVSRWDPSGTRMSEIEVPTPNVTSVAFGNEDLSSLYITTARDPYEGGERRLPSGSLFVAEVGVRGRLPQACRIAA